MRRNFLPSFFKYKSGFKLQEDKEHISTACSRSSAWSYSYDLKLSDRYEEAMKLAIKSENPETEVVDKPSSQFDSNEDLDSNFIFQGSTQIQELAGIEWISRLVADSFNNNNQKSRQENQRCRLQNDTEPERTFSTELQLPHIHKERSCSARIIRRLPEEINEKMCDSKLVSTKSWIQKIVVDDLLQYIQKTALQAIQKYEQLEQAYAREKMEWKKQVESLKLQNSLLKSELQDNKYHRVAEKVLAHLKIFYNRNHLEIDMNRNTRESIPFSKGISKSLDLHLEEQVRAEVNKIFNLSEPKYSVNKRELADLKSGFYKETNHLELESRATEGGNYQKKVLKDKKKLYRADPLKQLLPLQKPLQSRSVLQESKNTFDSDHCNELKFGNSNFPKIGAVTQKVDNMGTRICKAESSLFTKFGEEKPMKVKSYLERHSCPRNSFLVSNDEIWNDSGVRVWKDHKVGARKTTMSEDKENVPFNQEVSGVSSKVSQGIQDLRTLNKKILRTAVFDLDSLTFSDSRYPENQDMVLKLKGETLIDFDEMSQPVIARCLEQLEQLHSSERVNGSSGITIKSCWL